MQDSDIIQTPVLDPQAGEGLSPVQAKAVLDYFVSCGDRLSQMTKTYHDVEAVTRLLQEKENDLELAAKIGHELLERNLRLEERVNGLRTAKYLQHFRARLGVFRGVSGLSGDVAGVSGELR